MTENVIHILDNVRREALVAPLYNFLYYGLTFPGKVIPLPKPIGGGMGNPLETAPLKRLLCVSCGFGKLTGTHSAKTDYY
jgi:hypothetical protein